MGEGGIWRESEVKLTPTAQPLQTLRHCSLFLLLLEALLLNVLNKAPVKACRCVSGTSPLAVSSWFRSSAAIAVSLLRLLSGLLELVAYSRAHKPGYNTQNE